MPHSQLQDGTLVPIRVQVAAKGKSDSPGCGSLLTKDPAIVKMFSFGVNLDWQTQVLKVCASRAEWQLHGLMQQLPGVYGELGYLHHHLTSSTHLSFPQATQASFRPLNTLYHLRAFAHAVFSLWSVFPVPSPGSCLFFRSSWNVTSSPDPTDQVPAPSSIPLLNYVLLKCPKYFSFVVLIVVEITTYMILQPKLIGCIRAKQTLPFLFTASPMSSHTEHAPHMLT